MNRLLLLFAALLSLSLFAQTTDDDVVTKVLTAEQSLEKLTNLPTLYINTDSGSDPADTETYLTCTITWVDDEYTTSYVVSSEGRGIRGRGNSTWGQAKKPWRIKFKNKQKFLGTGYAKAKSWTLLANAFDPSLIRNALTKYVGKRVGMDFNPAAVFVDLVMNGTYRGTYQISDQVEINEHRIQATDVAGEEIDDQNDLTWLLEYCNASNKVDDPKFSLVSNNETLGYFQVKNPDQEETTNAYGTTSYTIDSNITNYVNNTWMPLMSTSCTKENYCDALTGYRSVNDERTLINWYVATEITSNWDGLYSIYFYRYPGCDSIPAGNMQWGPLWDEDLAYGNSYDNETYSTTYFPNNDFDQKLLADNNVSTTYKRSNPNFYRKFQPVVQHLWDDPWFATAVQNKLQNLIDNGIEDYLCKKIEDLRSELAQSAAKNVAKWPINSNTYSRGKTWSAQVDYLKSFISSRLSSMTTQVAKKNTNNRYFSPSSSTAFKSEKNINVVIDQGWEANAITTTCLPVNLTASQIQRMMGEGTVVYSFSNVTTEGNTTVLHFDVVSSIEAGKPYIVVPGARQPKAFSFLSTSTSALSAIEYDGYRFVGTSAPVAINASNVLSWTDNLPTCLSETTDIPALSAYLELPEGYHSANLKVSLAGNESFVINRNTNATIGDLVHLIQKQSEHPHTITPDDITHQANTLLQKK